MEEKEELPIMTDIEALLDKEEYDKAIKCCDKVLEICPASYKALGLKGYALYGKELYDDAIACCNEAIKLVPIDVCAWVVKGFVLHSKRLYDEAIGCFDEVIKLDSDNSVSWYNKGVVLMDKKLYDEAIICYDKAIKLNPDYFQAWHNKASALIEKGLLDEALECYDEAIRLNPDNMDALLRVATVLKDKKLDKEAEKYLYKAYLLDTSLTLHVETAGSLPNLIAPDKKYTMTSLTLTGDLNGTDIRFIHEIAGYDDGEGILSVLDLSGANIVSGGGYYCISDSKHPLYTEDDKVGELYVCLESISTPNSVTSIGEGAFECCTRLTSVTIGNSVTSIGERAFMDCIGLTSITVPNSVTSIKEGAFCGCEKLNAIIISGSVTEIGFYAFEGCMGLKDIHSNNPIPPTCYEYAFYNVSTDCKLYIPKGSYSAYSKAEGWEDFKNIIEVDMSVRN